MEPASDLHNDHQNDGDIKMKVMETKVKGEYGESTNQRMKYLNSQTRLKLQTPCT